jgi:hypothetical protein
MVAPKAVTYGEEAGKFGKYPRPLQVCEVPCPPPLWVQKFRLFELAPAPHQTETQRHRCKVIKSVIVATLT